MRLSFKENVVKKISELLSLNDGGRMLELGSGNSSAVKKLLEENKRIEYVGIEPSEKAYKEAIKEIGHLSNAKLKKDFGYQILDESNFDVSFSLSVLEHVKHLDKFIKTSVKAVKIGGYIVHSYDLGHSLHPSSLKERFQVFLGNVFPFILSEHKFVRYLDPEEVKREMESSGAEVFDITYHQMPNHKLFLKSLKSESEEADKLCAEIIDWEYKVSPLLNNLNKSVREKLFPTICVWGKRIK